MKFQALLGNPKTILLNTTVYFFFTLFSSRDKPLLALGKSITALGVGKHYFLLMRPPVAEAPGSLLESLQVNIAA